MDASGVAVGLGLPRSWPVRGEPELAGGGAKGNGVGRGSGFDSARGERI